MKRTFFKLAIVDDDEYSIKLFEKAVNEVKLWVGLMVFRNESELTAYLSDRQNNIPNILFLKLNLPDKNVLVYLQELRKQQRLQNTLITVYSVTASEESIEEAFVNGANIYMDQPRIYEEFKTVLEKVLKINFQYLESNLNIENFLYRI